jgi:hypothetical protein
MTSKHEHEIVNLRLHFILLKIFAFLVEIFYSVPRSGDGRHRRGTVWQAQLAALHHKQIANFLLEFRGDNFPGLQLPPLPSDLSRLDVHAVLLPQ